MKFDKITAKLESRLKEKLPGAEAHEMLRAHPVGGVMPDFGHKLPPRPGGVLILLYEYEGEIRFPLIKRPEYLGAHSGQVSFPGGKSESNENPIDTALREAEEEIGVHRQDIRVIGALSEFFVIPSNFIVTPVVASITYTPVFKPDPREVAGIFSGTINDLINDEAILEKELLAAGRFKMLAPYFNIGGETVWGATAMMLNEFRLVLKEIDQKFHDE